MTQEQYEAARSALNSVIFSSKAAAEQKQVARTARDRLMLDYVNQQVADIEARSAQFQRFIDEMTAVVASIGAKGPVEVVAKLRDVIATSKNIVESGKELVDEAKAVGATTAGAATIGATMGATKGLRRGVGGAGAPTRILCVHGVGDHHTDLSWEDEWRDAIVAGLRSWNPDAEAVFRFVLYDDIFERYPLDALSVASAFAKLSASGVWHGIGDAIGGIFGAKSRGMERGITDTLRWTAGMVVQWADDDDLRAECQARMRKSIQDFQPDVIAAHSLGTLVSYDTFVDFPKLMAGRRFVSFGSQIGNPTVRSAFGGRIVPLVATARWDHLYNPHDDAFTAPLRISAGNFRQVDATFDIPGILDHDAAHYLSHPAAVSAVWRDVAGVPRGFAKGLSRQAPSFAIREAPPERRALLVGINDYPDPENRLEGCVNDVYLMSAALQESGFKAADIRVVLNERATAAGILERLHWLLDDVRDGQQRVLFYSGHGAQIPAYGAKQEVDHTDECLVPYDFDWTPERAVADDQFFELYSQLPYDSRFVAILDCCHSGGMTRSSPAKIRGLNPPDDIRHRTMEWVPETQMWRERALPIEKRATSVSEKQRTAFLGSSGNCQRLGRAVGLRQQDRRRHTKERGRSKDHMGPYLPVIFEACSEAEFAMEYRHGVTAYGAFTYAFTKELREARKAKRRLTFQQLFQKTHAALKAMQYDQTPCLVGPKSVLRAPVPGGRPKP
jgi:hypothetical protein